MALQKTFQYTTQSAYGANKGTGNPTAILDAPGVIPTNHLNIHKAHVATRTGRGQWATLWDILAVITDTDQDIMDLMVPMEADGVNMEGAEDGGATIWSTSMECLPLSKSRNPKLTLKY